MTIPDSMNTMHSDNNNFIPSSSDFPEKSSMNGPQNDPENSSDSEPVFTKQQRSYFDVKDINIDEEDFKDILKDIDEQADEQKSKNEPLPQPQLNKRESMLQPENIIDCISNRFKYIKKLGKGASCNVLLCKERKSNKLYALKELPKNKKLCAMQFDRECRLLSLFKNRKSDHIMQFIDCFMDSKCYYIMMEYCSGPTLLQHTISMNGLSQHRASKLMRCILSAVNELHSMNVVHRDLKLNNLIFDQPFDAKNGIEPKLKLIDFGDSRVIETVKVYKTCIGTLSYIAPEMLRDRKGWEIKKSDMWSIGVMAFTLVTNSMPFGGNSQNEILKSIKIGKYKIPKECELSDECSDFIAKLLTLDTMKRMSCAEALKHAWISH